MTFSSMFFRRVLKGWISQLAENYEKVSKQWKCKRKKKNTVKNERRNSYFSDIG